MTSAFLCIWILISFYRYLQHEQASCVYGMKSIAAELMLALVTILGSCLAVWHKAGGAAELML